MTNLKVDVDILGDTLPSCTEQKEKEDSDKINLDTVNELSDMIGKLGGVSSDETNFTWEHFFTKHCGILGEDAIKYESCLIAHRLGPEQSLLESLSLIVEKGRIPFGDKLKIMKTLDRQQNVLKAKDEQAMKASKLLGLEGYNKFEAGTILKLGGGDSKYDIEYGIEQWEDGQSEMERMVAISTLKGGKAMEGFVECTALGFKFSDPTMKLLNSFGYFSFDYTKGKTTEIVKPHEDSLLSMNCTEEVIPQSDSVAGMYS